ncbi:hypothetical protein AB1Y20_021509 [Prymnesium parvum]|uniref:Uncharacterized protein n=1 Tax=Prymnesium parvum TaxID=97485 RepID=A0AB34JLR5_PRYPA
MEFWKQQERQVLKEGSHSAQPSSPLPRSLSPVRCTTSPPLATSPSVGEGRPINATAPPIPAAPPRPSPVVEEKPLTTSGHVTPPPVPAAPPRVPRAASPALPSSPPRHPSPPLPPLEDIESSTLQDPPLTRSRKLSAWLSEPELTELTPCVTSKECVPSAAALSAGAKPLGAGEAVYREEVAGKAEEWQLCFVQGTGWTFLPAACISRQGAEQPPASGSGGVAHAADERYKVAMELAQTEKSYGKAMRLMAETLVKPMRELELLSEVEVAKLFSCAEQALPSPLHLLRHHSLARAARVHATLSNPTPTSASSSSKYTSRLHPDVPSSPIALPPTVQMAELCSSLLADVERCVNEWSAASCVGEVFLQDGSAHHLSALYVQFINNYEQSTRMLAACEERAEFRAFVRHWQVLMQATGHGGCTLRSLLIQPVQRVPRYKMLLEQLLKHTPHDHADHGPATRALAAISRLATGVNEAVRRREAVEKVVEVEKYFVGAVPLQQPGRWFVREGKMSKQSRHGKESVTVILFNDALLYAEKKLADGGKLSLRRILSPIEKVQPSSGNACELQVFSPEKSITLIAASSEERDSWVNDVREVAHRAVKGASDDEHEVAPVWTPDAAATHCMTCGHEFSVLRRRHHCRSCGKVLCAGCSESRVSMPGLYDDKAVRVCKPCYAQVRMKTTVAPSPERMESNSSSLGRLSLNARTSGVGRPSGKRSSLRSSQLKMSTAGGVVLQGWLQKKGGGGSDGSLRNWAKGGRRNWKKRWVVITDKQFVSWFDKREEETRELKGSLGLHGAQVIAGKVEGRFWVLTNTRSLELAADSKAAAEMWISVLQQTANKALVPSDLGDMEEEVDTSGDESQAERMSQLSHMSQEDDAPQLRASGNLARVMYSYSAQEPGEMSIEEGELIEVISDEDDWWVGRIGDRCGSFPNNYVQVEPVVQNNQANQRVSAII